MLHNYPPSWVSTFIERKLHKFDPVLLSAERTPLPFSWDAPDFRARLTPQQHEVLADAGSIGLARGYTIPIHRPWTPAAPRASCSVVPDSSTISARSYFAVQLMSTYLYDAATRKHAPQTDASRQGALSLRERQCPEFAAQGKSDWAIGQILHISEHTVHRHIESAKQRLGVATRVQAIIRALHGRQISIGDVILSDPAPIRPTTH